MSLTVKSLGPSWAVAEFRCGVNTRINRHLDLVTAIFTRPSAHRPSRPCRPRRSRRCAREPSPRRYRRARCPLFHLSVGGVELSARRQLPAPPLPAPPLPHHRAHTQSPSTPP